MISNWTLLKMLFKRSKVSSALKKFSDENIEDFKQKALEEENYEFAAYLQYYLNFKSKKKTTTINKPEINEY